MLTLQSIAKSIDHSILHPTFTDLDLVNNCEIAVKYGVATVCVKPYHTASAFDIVRGSGVEVCTVIGFPHGNSTTQGKVAETLEVIALGAKEVDMVVNVGKVIQHDWDYVKQEIHAINEACISNGAILKVIFENDFLKNDNDKIKLCEICNDIEVAFVKTSTGFGFVKQDNGDYNYAGATEHDLTLMRKHCKTNVQIKAAGGIKTLEQILHVLSLGATRVGASATVQILTEAASHFQ